MRQELKKYLAILLCFALIMSEFPQRTEARSGGHQVGLNRDDLMPAAANRLWNLVRSAYAPNRVLAETPALHPPKVPVKARRAGHQAQAGPKSQATSLPGQSLTLLPDGRFLALGGQGERGSVANAAIFDPATSTVSRLATGMLHPRAWHTATMLPEGTIIVLGGLGTNGEIEKSVELFDPATSKFVELKATGLKPRAHHTATLLTDGRLLIVGGVSLSGETLDSAEFFSFKTKTKTGGDESLGVPTQGHTATLNPDGTVLLWGGSDKFGQSLTFGEVFDPVSNRFRVETTPFQNPADVETLSLKLSIPSDRDEDVPVDSYVVLRLSHAIAAKSANSGSLQLSGPNGTLAAKVVPAEGGMLSFVTPVSVLAAGTKYTLEISGLQDSQGTTVPESFVTFTTAGKKDTGDNGIGVIAGGTAGNGSSDSAQKLPPLKAPAGVTALAGQTLLLNGSPLQDVTFRVEDTAISTKSDGTGRFLLKNMPAGHHVLIIDGRTARGSKESYGVFEVGVDIADGKTNVLDYTVWMTALDEAHAVKVPFPTTSEVVVTNPELPGLEFHIPPNTTITDSDGNVASEISITAIPISQPPFPLPKVQVPIYFTIQPGAGYISVAGSTGTKGARLIYPNTYNSSVGSRYNFWNYDADEKGWFVYGHGSVSPDRKSIIPDPGVEIYELTGAMVATGMGPGKGPCSGCPNDGDPVDLGTGLFIYQKTDLALPDTTPISLSRTYRQNDGISRAFGNGTALNYDIFLMGDSNPYTYQELVVPDGGRVRFDRISPGTEWTAAVYRNLSTPGEYYGATINWFGPALTGNRGWLLTRRDGTVMQFPESAFASRGQQAALLSITDRNGNVVMLNRDSNSNLVQILSPNGRYINLSYDTSNRVTQATDNIGRTVLYSYNPNGYLSQVTDATGGLWTYGYDTSNRMSTITDPRQILFLKNDYDSNDRVYVQTQADNSTYRYSYVTDTNGNVTQTTVTDPRNNVRIVSFTSPGVYPSGFQSGAFETSDVAAYGTSVQKTTTFQRQPGTNLLASVNDSLGRTTSYTYDSLGSVTSITRLAGTPNSVTSTFAYDATYSLLTSATDPLGHKTLYSYDTKGNLTSVTDPLGRTTTYQNTSSGQVASITDSAGNTTQFGYSGGDVVSVTDPVGRIISRTVDGAGRILSITNPLGQTVKNTYNAANQMLSVTDSGGAVTTMTFDPNGNLKSITDARNTSNSTTFDYDNLDRLASRKDALGIAETYLYDVNGNLTQFTDRRGKVSTFNYDALNRRTFAGYGTQSGPTYESTVDSTYDAGDRLTQVVDSITGTITRIPDGLDRLTSETTPQGTISYSYDAAGRRTSATVTGRAAVTYGYNNANQLTSVTQGSAVTGFGYDPLGRRSTLTLPNGVAVSYSYDQSSQVTGINYQLGSTSLGNLSYSYDVAGRRSGVTGSLARSAMPSPLSSAIYDAANRLTQWGGTTLSYDANGNLTYDGVNTYTWDARNHLASITGGTTASFQYDPFGRRISRNILSSAANFLYDGGNAIQELANGSPTADVTSGGIDEAFVRSDASGASSFLLDALGNSLALTDSAGTIQTQYTYDPFGKTTITGQPSSNQAAFTGRESDATGLYFYRSRYYNPTLQRFISEDSVGLAGGPNQFEYSASCPQTYTDPSGRFGAAGCLYGMAMYVDFELLPQLLIGRKQPTVGEIAINLATNCAWGIVGGFLFEGLGAAFRALRGLGPVVEAGESVAARAEVASSRALGRNLEEAGVSRPADSAAHHIVAGNDARAAEARSALQREGVGINDADNGVFLPKNSTVSNPTGAQVHSTVHTDVYYNEVNQELSSAAPGTVRDVLADIASRLLSGSFPH